MNTQGSAASKKNLSFSGKKMFRTLPRKESQKKLSYSTISNKHRYHEIPKLAVPPFLQRPLLNPRLNQTFNGSLSRPARSTLKFNNQFTHPLLSTSRKRIKPPITSKSHIRSKSPMSGRSSRSLTKGSNKKVRFKDDLECDVKDDDASVFQEYPSEKIASVTKNRKKMNLDRVNKFKRERGLKRYPASGSKMRSRAYLV